MRSAKHVADDMRFVSEFRDLCDVMQQTAVSRLKRHEESLTQAPSLMAVLRREFFPLLPASTHEERWMRGGERGQLVVVLTADEGMVGPLHANTVRQALAIGTEPTHWILVGQRAMPAD